MVQLLRSIQRWALNGQPHWHWRCPHPQAQLGALWQWLQHCHLSPESCQGELKLTVEFTVDVVVPKITFHSLPGRTCWLIMSRTIKTAEAKSLPLQKNCTSHGSVLLKEPPSPTRIGFSFSTDGSFTSRGGESLATESEGLDTKHLSLTQNRLLQFPETGHGFPSPGVINQKTLHTKMQWLYSGCTDMCSPGHWQAKSSAPVQRRYLWAGTTLPPPKQLGRSHLESEASEPLWIHANLPQPWEQMIKYGHKGPQINQ